MATINLSDDMILTLISACRAAQDHYRDDSRRLRISASTHTTPNTIHRIADQFDRQVSELDSAILLLESAL